MVLSLGPDNNINLINMYFPDSFHIKFIACDKPVGYFLGERRIMPDDCPTGQFGVVRGKYNTFSQR